jgi:hypothetical protein
LTFRGPRSCELSHHLQDLVAGRSIDLDAFGPLQVDEDVERDQAGLVGLHQCHQLLFELLEVLELAFPDAVGAEEDKRLGHGLLFRLGSCPR